MVFKNITRRRFFWPAIGAAGMGFLSSWRRDNRNRREDLVETEQPKGRGGTERR